VCEAIEPIEIPLDIHAEVPTYVRHRHGWARPRGGPKSAREFSPIALSSRPISEYVRDPRYGSVRWRKTAAAVIARDRACLIVAGCSRPPRVADHVISAYPAMPDALFFGMGNLRAGCFYHNNARGMATKLEAEAITAPALVTGDYSK
jgi:hypothetical protein